MVNRCNLCQKDFEYPYLLERHKNRKTPCNAIKSKFNCTLCDISFDHKSRLDTHNLSNKHKNNYNVYIENLNITNNITNNINNNINIINTFENTNISNINNDFIELTYVSDFELKSIFKDFEDEGEYTSSNMYYVLCFKYFIKIFSKLNFNIAFNENHNCRCVSFTLSNNVVEYQILSYDIILKEYTWETIDYYIFIDKFLNLMHNIDDKYNNENFKNVLNYIEKYKFRYIKTKDKIIKPDVHDPSESCKIDIEKELLLEYNKFKKVKEDVTDEETQIARRREENRLELKREAKQLTLMRNTIESQMAKQSVNQLTN